MGQGNARVGRGRDSAADARHFLKGHARGQQFLGFFAAAPENVGVAALEPGHHVALFGLAHQQGVDLVLGQGVVARHLAHVDQFGVGPGVPQQAVVGQGVVNHHVRRGQGVPGLEGQQARIAGACSQKIDFHCTPPRASSSRVRAPKPDAPTGQSGDFLAFQSTPAMSRCAQRTPSRTKCFRNSAALMAPPSRGPVWQISATSLLSCSA